MKARPIEPSDIPILKEWAGASGFPYIEPVNALVITDDDDRPIMACASRPIVELYLWADGERPAPVKLAALRMLHAELTPTMKQQGFNEVNAFLPPTIAETFGRRLVRSFGWVKNWPSYYKKL